MKKRLAWFQSFSGSGFLIADSLQGPFELVDINFLPVLIDIVCSFSIIFIPSQLNFLQVFILDIVYAWLDCSWSKSGCKCLSFGQRCCWMFYNWIVWEDRWCSWSLLFRPFPLRSKKGVRKWRSLQMTLGGTLQKWICLRWARRRNWQYLGGLL